MHKGQQATFWDGFWTQIFDSKILEAISNAIENASSDRPTVTLGILCLTILAITFRLLSYWERKARIKNEREKLKRYHALRINTNSRRLKKLSKDRKR